MPVCQGSRGGRQSWVAVRILSVNFRRPPATRVGGAKVVGLTSVMEERLGVPVQLAEPFRNFRVSMNLDKASLAEVAPLLGVAIGLAIRRPGDK